MQIIPLTFRVDKLEQVKLGDSELECFRCEVLPLKNTFWITQDGRLIKVQQGPLVMELTAVK